VVVRTPPGTSLSGTDETAKEAERILLGSPHVKDVSTEVGEETVTLRVRLISDLKRVKTTRQVV